MKIKRLEMRGFTRHTDTQLVFPDHGIVVVNGENGSGKSSIIEAVAIAGWGKTLRGRPPWAGDKGEVVVELVDGTVLTRKRRGDKTSLTIAGPGWPTYETTTKAQEALETKLWPFDLWKRARVFSSQDAAHFTGATDADRKRILETILGLDRFDGALDACRVDLRDAERMQASVQATAASAEVSLAFARERAADARATLASLGNVGVPAEAVDELKRLNEQAGDLRRAISGQEEAIRRERDVVSKAVARSEECDRKLHKLSGETCFTCGQAIPEKLRVPLKREVDAARAMETVAQEDAARTIAGLTANLDQVRAALEAIEPARGKLTADVRASAGAREAILRAQRAASEADAAAVAASDALVDADLEGAVSLVRELTAVDRVLGTRGVRANVLGRALGGLESIANGWLERVAGSGLSLRLASTRELAAGGSVDEVALEVVGAGGGHGYRAASGGERRRIDVALLFALAELAEAARGDAGGTLFIDEVFDSLDVLGVNAVAAALEEVARDRVVVVVTHNTMLASKINAAQRWSVIAGRVA